MTVEEIVKLIGISYRKDIRIRFLPKPNFPVKPSDLIIVEHDGELKLAKVVRTFAKMEVHKWDEITEKEGFSRILRKADSNDLKFFEKLNEKERTAFKICKDKIALHALPMHLIETVWEEKEKKYVFYFTADSRVDFRELVKDLASTFNTKIQLWQVGSRDAMHFFGGLGPCGYPLCCTSFLKDIESVELSFARMQNLPMNVAKLTGTCGRLVCCLRYELNKGEPVKIEDIHIPPIPDGVEEEDY